MNQDETVNSFLPSASVSRIARREKLQSVSKGTPASSGWVRGYSLLFSRYIGRKEVDQPGREEKGIVLGHGYGWLIMLNDVYLHCGIDTTTTRYMAPTS